MTIHCHLKSFFIYKNIFNHGKSFSFEFSIVTSHKIGRNFQNALLRMWAVAIKQQKHRSLEFSAGKLNNIIPVSY